MPTANEIALADMLIRWKRDPIAMAVEEFGFTPDKWQAEALRAFPDPTKQRIALQACVGVGKTIVKAIIGWNFLTCYVRGRDHPYGLATSVDAANLSSTLWKELANCRERSRFCSHAFEMNSERIYERQNPLTWRLEARTWSKKADSDAQGRTLSGLHAKFILYLIDECGDINPAVLRAAEQGLSNCEFGKIVVGGNPSSHAGILYFVVKEQPHLWTIIRVTADPDDPNRSPRINQDWARAMVQQFGRTNPWVMYAILGLFPPVGVNALFGPDEVADAMKRHLLVDAYAHAQTRIGIDVARFGDDRTVLFARQGLHAARRPVEMRNARTEAIAARVMVARERIGSELELIDDSGGWSAGVQDVLRLGGVEVYPVNFGGKADDPRYFNKRTEMYWRLAEWIKAGGALPNLPELARELCAHTYWYEDSRIRLTEKEQVKALLNGHSPDFCLVAGTLVRTPTGAVPIEQLVPGDAVSTPMGVRHVVGLWRSWTERITTAEFSNGAVLVGRPEHKVFTWDSGFVLLDALSLTNEIESDSVLRRIAWASRRKWCMPVRPSGFKQQVGIISPVGRMRRSDFFTAGFGATCTARFLTVARSIIATAIGRTTMTRIWSAWNRQSISNSMGPLDVMIPCSVPARAPISTPSGIWPRSGMEAPKVSRGTHSMGEPHGRAENLLPRSVPPAVRATSRSSRVDPDSVRSLARGGSSSSRIKRLTERALAAGKRLYSIAIGRKPVVPVRVQTVSAPLTPVFNLALDEDHVYYANGILVANSDALALTFALVDMPSQTTPEGLMVGGRPGHAKDDWDVLREA